MNGCMRVFADSREYGYWFWFDPIADEEPDINWIHNSTLEAFQLFLHFGFCRAAASPWETKKSAIWSICTFLYAFTRTIQYSCYKNHGNGHFQYDNPNPNPRNDARDKRCSVTLYSCTNSLAGGKNDNWKILHGLWPKHKSKNLGTKTLETGLLYLILKTPILKLSRILRIRSCLE